ncbi:MAG: hypothetical protein IJS01_00150 [Lentisphaeria bacterium]|nr:hypothetical protein [Lentisphaeria bacterium]
MSGKVSFLSAFFGVCSGVAVFHRLRFQSWGRTVFHVILLAVLASLLITSGEMRRRRPAIRAAAGAFAAVFGNKVLNAPEGLLPEKQPGAARSIVLPGGGLLCYFPKGEATLSAKELEKCLYVVFWAPRGFATAVRGDADSWTASTVVPGSGRVELTGNRTLTTSGLLRLKLDAPGKWDIEGRESFTVRELAATCTAILRAGLMIENLLLTILLPFLYTAVFAGMFRLTAAGRAPRRLRGLEFWKVGLYAGFPSLAVASAFPALDLPLFSFGTVYMVGLLIYWLYVTARLERDLAEQEKELPHE